MGIKVQPYIHSSVESPYAETVIHLLSVSSDTLKHNTSVLTVKHRRQHVRVRTLSPTETIISRNDKQSGTVKVKPQQLLVYKFNILTILYTTQFNFLKSHSKIF